MTSLLGFTRGLAHLANFITAGSATPLPGPELVFKFKTRDEAMRFEASLKASRLPSGQALVDANETPGQDRFTFLGMSIKVQHPDVRPYAPLVRTGEKA